MWSTLARSDVERASSGARFLRCAGSGALGLSLALLLSACGGSSGVRDVSTKSDRRPGEAVVPRIDPVDLFPADLDLVIRVDVARMNAALGPALAVELSQRAGLDAASDDHLVRRAMSRAAVVWLGLRLVDIDAGDRVVVVEGDLGSLQMDPGSFQPIETNIPGVSISDRSKAPARSGTARIIRIGDRAAVFVSPMEVDSVARVMRDGADGGRGDPSREGVVSLDLRPRRLPASLERRFPSIGSIIAGIRRVRASVMPVDGGVRVDAEIVARNKPAAERVIRFLSTLRDNVEEPQSEDLMKALSMEQVEASIRVRWILSAKVLSAVSQPSAGRP